MQSYVELAWRAIPEEKFRNLVETLPHRVKAVTHTCEKYENIKVRNQSSTFI